jgi:predicted nucleic acid-binding protein
MAQPQIILALDSGALIAAEKDPRVEAVIRKWLREGARILIPAPSIAEAVRGGPKDAAANRLIKAVNQVADTSEAIARDAGGRLGSKRSSKTIDALVVATAEACRATDILTSDPVDIRALAGDCINVIVLH